MFLCDGIKNLEGVSIPCYVMKWKHFPRYWPFVRGIHRSPVDSPHKGPVTRSFVQELLTKQTKGRWIKMSLCSFDVAVMTHLTSNGPPKSLLCYGCMIAYMFGVVNFDALTQASEFRIERRQIVFLCWMKDLKLGSHQISSLDFTADWLSHLALGIYIYIYIIYIQHKSIVYYHHFSMHWF